MSNNKGKSGWFKTKVSTEPEKNVKAVEKKPVEKEGNMSEKKAIANPVVDNILSRSNKDKFISDLVSPLEDLIKDRELLMVNKQDLENKLNVANSTIDRMKNNIDDQEKKLVTQVEEIKSLEKNLSEKQTSYDQLLEDYKNHQNVARREYAQISNKLDLEISKYNRFSDETTTAQRRNIDKINVLEEKIRSLEIERDQYSKRYDEANKEKEALIKNIDDFTKRMTNPALFMEAKDEAQSVVDAVDAIEEKEE